MADTKHLFAVHKLNEAGMSKAQELADKFNELTELIDSFAADGRSKSIAFTKLEEASFFAKKAMAENPVNQLQ